MKKSFALALTLALALCLFACGAADGKPGAPEGTPPASQGADSKPSGGALYDITGEDLNVLADSERNAVLAEIPSEIFKGIGELKYCNITTSYDENYKYTVAIQVRESGEADLVKLVEYYRSIGGAVEETGNKFNPYAVTFDWGESVEVKAYEDSLSLQFNVVKA